ncbi:hypothetical protein TWF481_010290 [Arthrobotrys musiformis]|uniref:BTB domain-containing protein n=1 Tax=Arthrobotrys musiformis TaxID=47236 RepID=A0AAV9W0C5_9PEZI
MYRDQSNWRSSRKSWHSDTTESSTYTPAKSSSSWRNGRTDYNENRSLIVRSPHETSPDRFNKSWRDRPTIPNSPPARRGTRGGRFPPGRLDRLRSDIEATKQTGNISSAFGDVDIGQLRRSKTDLVPTSRITITENYNCIVVATREPEEVIHYQVSADVLKPSSAIISEMIDDAYAVHIGNGRSDNGRENDKISCIRLELKGDTSLLEVILRVLHGNEGECETTLENLTFQQVAKVAAICQKYKWEDVVKPWSQSWIEKYEPYALEPGYEDWLLIAGVFDTQKQVQELIAVLGNTCGIFPPGRVPRPTEAEPGRGRLFLRDKRVVDASLWPPTTFSE